MSILVYSSIGVATLGSLFSFIAYGTLGWSYQTTEFAAGGGCNLNYDFYVGLYKYREHVELECGGSSESDTKTYDTDCDGLNDDQCDLLKGAQNAAGTAVAAAVLLIIAQVLLLIFMKLEKQLFLTISIITSAVVAVIFGVTAFTSVGNWKDLTDDIDDDLENFDADVSYSWYLMLFGGLMSMSVAVISVIIFFKGRNGSDESASLNKA